MQEAARPEAFVAMLRRLREPLVLALRSGRIVAANVAGAEALGTSVAAVEGASLASFSVDLGSLRDWLDGPRADAPLALRARDGRRLVCDASLLARDLLLLRLSGGPPAVEARTQVLETMAWLREGTAGVSDRQTLDELLLALITQGMGPLGATAVGLFLIDETGTKLELELSVGYTDGWADRFRMVPLAAALPITDSVKSAAPVFIRTARELAARYPDLAALPEAPSFRAIACVPLETEGRVVGAVDVGFPLPWSFDEEDRVALTAVTAKWAKAFEWARGVRRPSSPDPAEGRASRVERLHAFTRALAQAITPADVVEAIVDMGHATTSAQAVGLWLLSSDGSQLCLERRVGGGGPLPQDHTRLAIDGPARMAILDAVRNSTPVWIESRRQLDEHYTEVSRVMWPEGEASLACVPLFVLGRCIGGLAYKFKGVRRFVEEERAFLQVLAWHSAQAIERSRLYAAEQRAREAAEASQRRSDFLAGAGTLLASSLDYSTTLAGVARAAVPRVADWCLVELEDDRLRGVPPVAAHVDPSKVHLVLEFSRRFRALVDREHGIPGVMRFGKSQLYRSVSAEQLRDSLGDAELGKLLQEIGMVSSVVVPILARGHTLGAIVLNSASRHYDENDLAMAESLGHKAGLAVDNARLYRDARDADRQKDEFLAMLSHELRNPLAPIVTALELMKLRGIEAFASERAIISRNVELVVRLVDDMLDVERITRGKIELRMELCELSQVIAKAVEMVSPAVEERGHTLAISAPLRGLPVMADQVRLAQAIANLLANANKYTERGGKIAVAALAEGSEAIIRVIDSGIGIPPETMPKIFDLFVQEKRALDRAKGGLGVGLTVVRALVGRHGGSVSAKSEGLGRGSEFVIRLPLAVREARGASIPAPPSSSAVLGEDSGRLRVLVVDDNADAANMLCESLRALGYEVRVTYDGGSALAAAAEFEPHLVLVDIGLPGMNGYELVGHLRRLEAPPRRIVAVTGYGYEDDFRSSREAGFDEHVIKPMGLDTLRAVLDRSRDAISLVEKRLTSEEKDT